MTTPVYVISKTALKDLDPTQVQVAIYKSSNGLLTYHWCTDEDYSARVAADTYEVLFVAADGISPALGAWVLQYDGPVCLNWWEIDRKGVTACGDKTNAALSMIGALGGGGLVIKPGRYRADKTWHPKNNTRIFAEARGSVTIDFGLDTHSSVIGTSTGSMIHATGSLGAIKTIAGGFATRGSTYLPFTASTGIQAGSLVKLESLYNSLSDDWTDLEELGNRSDAAFYGEFAQVTGGAVNLNLRNPLNYKYPAGSRVQEFEPVENIVIEGLRFVSTPGNPNYRHRVKFVGAINCEVKDCIFEETYYRAVEFWSCMFCNADKNYIRFPEGSGTASDNAVEWQGIGVIDACLGIEITRNTILNATQAIDLTYSTSNTDWDGVPRGTLIEKNTIVGASYSAITDHPGCEGTRIINNKCERCNGGIFVRSRGAIVALNRLSGHYFPGKGSPVNEYGIWLGEDGHYIDTIIQGNQIEDFERGIVVAGVNSSIHYRNVSILANVIKRTNVAIFISTGATSAVGSGVVIDGNQISQVSGNFAIYIIEHNDTPTVRSNRIKGPCANAAIRIIGCVKPVVMTNEFDSLGANIETINLTGCTGYVSGGNFSRGVVGSALDDAGAAYDAFAFQMAA